MGLHIRTGPTYFNRHLYNNILYLLITLHVRVSHS